MCHLPISGVLPPNLDLSPVTHLSSFKKPNIVKKRSIPEHCSVNKLAILKAEPAKTVAFQLNEKYMMRPFLLIDMIV